MGTRETVSYFLKHHQLFFQRDDRRYIPPPWEGGRGRTPI